MKDIFSKVMNPPVEDTKEETASKEALIGVVKKCVKLNIRKQPKIDAEPVTVVDVNTVLMIEPSQSTKEWLKVYTEAGVEGYCMKKFVEYSE